MSKSIGNVIDPLELIDTYGADALRFTLIEHATGQDIYLNTEWVSGARNFCNKLWNAARFVLTNAGDREVTALPDSDRRDLSDRWILSRLADTTDEVTSRLESFELAAAARSIYDFIWTEFCDWYIESAKVRLSSQDERVVSEAVAVLVRVLEQALRLAHPIMPFVTDEIWRKLPIQRPAPSIMIAPWPQTDPGWRDPAVEADFERVQSVVTAIRSFRSEKGLSPKLRLRPVASSADGETLATIKRERDLVSRLAGLESLRFVESLDGTPGARVITGPVELAIPLEGLLDVEAERQRLQKLIDRTDQEISKIAAKLNNEGFVGRAPAEVVAEQRRRLEEESAAQSKLKMQLSSLG
jgi:valyl-tRNA synthetase